MRTAHILANNTWTNKCTYYSTIHDMTNIKLLMFRHTCVTLRDIQNKEMPAGPTYEAETVSVPKLLHIKFRRRGITQIRNTTFRTQQKFEIRKETHAATCRCLIFVIKCIVISDFVGWCINPQTQFPPISCQPFRFSPHIPLGTLFSNTLSL